VPEGAWKTATRDVDLVETVKLQTAPGETRRPAPFPSPLRVFAKEVLYIIKFFIYSFGIAIGNTP